jgi:hypothetical protein
MAIEAVITQLNGSALGKAIANSEGAAKAPPQGSSFKDVLSQMDGSGMDMAQQLGMSGNQNVAPSEQMVALQGDGVSFQPGDQVSSSTSPDASHKVVDMLGDVNKSQMQMDSLMNNILYSGKRFSSQELLCMQAYVFQHSQTIELMVKLADQTVSSAKSVLNTQIQ